MLFNDEQNTVVFCHFGYFFGHFWQKNTSNFPAQYRIDHLLLRISQIQSVQSILLQRFMFWHGVTALTVWTVKKVKSSLFCTMNLEKKKTKTKKWLYHHSLAHLINDKIIANTVCLYIYYNLTYISQLSYYYSITLLHISAQNWFICLNHSSNLFIALIEKWERKKTRQKYWLHTKKNHPQRFKGLLLGVNPFLSFFCHFGCFLAIFGKKNLPNPWKIVFVQKWK